jgi:hypothetical protein
MGVGGNRDAPAALPPRNTQYPLYRRLGGPQGGSGRVRKISPPPGFHPRVVQPLYCILYPRNPTKLNARSILHFCIFTRLKFYKWKKNECDIIHTWAPGYQVGLRIWPATYWVWRADDKESNRSRISKDYFCLSVTNNNVTLETTLHTNCKHL